MKPCGHFCTCPHQRGGLGGGGPSPRLSHPCLPLCLPPFQDRNLEPGTFQERCPRGSRVHRGASCSSGHWGQHPRETAGCGLRATLPTPGSFLGAGFTNEIISKSLRRSWPVGVECWAGCCLCQVDTDALGGQERPGEAARGHVAVTSPQPAPPRCGWGGRNGGPLILTMLQGVGAGGGDAEWNPRPLGQAAPSSPAAFYPMMKPHLVKSPVCFLQADTLPGTCPRRPQQEGVSTCSGVPSFGALEGASDPCTSGWDLEARVRARPRRAWGADGLCSHPLARFSPNGHYGFARPRRPVLWL